MRAINSVHSGALYQNGTEFAVDALHFKKPDVMVRSRRRIRINRCLDTSICCLKTYVPGSYTTPLEGWLACTRQPESLPKDAKLSSMYCSCRRSVASLKLAGL